MAARGFEVGRNATGGGSCPRVTIRSPNDRNPDVTGAAGIVKLLWPAIAGTARDSAEIPACGFRSWGLPFVEQVEPRDSERGGTRPAHSLQFTVLKISSSELQKTTVYQQVACVEKHVTGHNVTTLLTSLNDPAG